MSGNKRTRLRMLEGRSVNLALADGSRIDDAVLISATATTAWIYSNGADGFVPLADVIDVWEARTAA